MCGPRIFLDAFSLDGKTSFLFEKYLFIYL